MSEFRLKSTGPYDLFLKLIFCSRHRTQLLARMGEHDWRPHTEPLPHPDYDVRKIIAQKDFDAVELTNDIALLKLEREVNRKDHIDRIVLDGKNSDFVNQSVKTSGWSLLG